MSIAKRFAEDVETFLTERDMRPASFGRAAVGDPLFVFELRDGRNVQAATMDKIYYYMEAVRKEPAASAA